MKRTYKLYEEGKFQRRVFICVCVRQCDSYAHSLNANSQLFWMTSKWSRVCAVAAHIIRFDT